jgi:Fe2+ transport system protein FeoA
LERFDRRIGTANEDEDEVIETPDSHGTLNLLAVPAGMRARIHSFKGIPREKVDRLTAFGVTPGRWILVRQHRPETVIQVDFTELALEAEVAKFLIVDDIRSGEGGPPGRRRRDRRRHNRAERGRGEKRRRGRRKR